MGSELRSDPAFAYSMRAWRFCQCRRDREREMHLQYTEPVARVVRLPATKKSEHLPLA